MKYVYWGLCILVLYILIFSIDLIVTDMDEDNDKYYEE
jgi:hypothetical protein